MHIYLYIHVHHIYMCIHTYIHTWTHTYTNIRTYINVHIHLLQCSCSFVRTCIHTFLPTYACTYICMHIHTCYTQTIPCLHTYAHTYIHLHQLHQYTRTQYIQFNLSRTVVPTEYVTRATLIIQHNGEQHQCVNYKRVDDTMYFNVRCKTSQKSLSGHECVTDDRIQLYEDGLNGGGRDVENCDLYLKRYAQLFKVTLQNNGVVCECRDFFHALVCTHVLVWEHVCDGSSFLSTALSSLPRVGVKKGKKVSCNSSEISRKTPETRNCMRSKVRIGVCL
jgi:hypothetical protein